MEAKQFSQELIQELLEKTLLACHDKESEHFGKEVIDGVCSWGFETHPACVSHYTDMDDSEYFADMAYSYCQENGLEDSDAIPMVFNTYWEYDGQVQDGGQEFNFPNTLTIEEMLPYFVNDFQMYLDFIKEETK